MTSSPNSCILMTYAQLLSFLWSFMRLQKWTFLAILLLDFFTWSSDAVLWPYILHLVIDTFTRYDHNRLAVWETLTTPVICALGLVLYVETASRTMGFLMARAIPKLQADLRMAMFDQIQHHSPHYFNERFAGSLANKMTDMTTQVETILQQLFWPLIPALSGCLLGAAFLWFVNPLFTWILLGWTLIHLAVCLKFTRSVDTYEQKHAEARSVLLGKVVDSFTNNFAVNLFYRFAHERTLLSPLQKEEARTNAAARCYIEKMRCVLGTFYFFAIIVGVLGTLLYLWIHGHVTTGQVVQVFATTWSLIMILWTVGSSLPVLFQSFGIIKQAYVVMQEPQDLGDRPNAQELKVSRGEITFDRVHFRYADKALFTDKSVQIRGGEKVGLVGYTGAGKSTFVNLILRLFPLQKGAIYIDGQEIASVSLASLRGQIALIPQDPVLFHRSLRENICYGKPEATEEEIKRAALLAHCDEFIRRIPGGYEAKVGERGTKLSGGEKQRIAIARALLLNAPILILDEATSSLDSLTEKYIQEGLDALMHKKTSLVIAHRLSTLSRLDRILVFDQGAIIEEGTHTSLMHQKGLYARMWDCQVGGFLPAAPT